MVSTLYNYISPRILWCTFCHHTNCHLYDNSHSARNHKSLDIIGYISIHYHLFFYLVPGATTCITSGRNFWLGLVWWFTLASEQGLLIQSCFTKTPSMHLLWYRLLSTFMTQIIKWRHCKSHDITPLIVIHSTALHSLSGGRSTIYTTSLKAIAFDLNVI
jgi:hypothetical protein